MAFESEPGRLFLSDEQNQLLAEVTWQEIVDGKVMAVDHTFVDPSLRGQGIAAQLIAAVVESARLNHKQIMPLCTYAKHEFEHRPEYGDVYYHNPKGATK